MAKALSQLSRFTQTIIKNFDSRLNLAFFNLNHYIISAIT